MMHRLLVLVIDRLCVICKMGSDYAFFKPKNSIFGYLLKCPDLASCMPLFVSLFRKIVTTRQLLCFPFAFALNWPLA
jgi:hypothetical protein